MAGNVPSRKKSIFAVGADLRSYLETYGRHRALPVHYDDLLHYQQSFPLLDRNGNDTLWESVYYSEQETAELNRALTLIYALLKTDGDVSVMEHLQVARIDYCTYGNSKPFRIRIINRLNDNYDHFYLKRADASRIYGLELEDLLSPNRFNYLVDAPTMVEEHIAGIPGDVFIKYHLEVSHFDQIRIAKEFVKFNERCFVRLLGDMRAYNYVVDITPDIEGNQYRIRAIDFDQQSYEGRKNFYFPQYFKENNDIIFLGIRHMAPRTVIQYQLEERSLIASRIKKSHLQVEELFKAIGLRFLAKGSD
ncbi:MAG: hypothetical protein NWR67_12630, partial [Saprospiraceae bacterium]|nr:hypothetical protein [Saprospiraceae bacterium]